MNTLQRRVEKLEAQSPDPTDCLTCGVSGLVGMVAVGQPSGQALPRWVNADGCCTGCGRRVRVYVGIDMSVV